MNVSNIIEMLNANDLSEVEVLREKEESLLVNFYFDFDKDLLDAAKAYANEESDEEEESEKWLMNYFFPYLYDYANDEVLEIIEDITEQEEIAGEMMAFQMTKNTSNYVQFMALFTEEESNLSIEEAVKDYMS